MYLRFNEYLKFLVSVDIVSSCCFANVLCPGYDNPLLIFGMIFSVVVNTSPEVWVWLSCNFLVTWLVNLCLIVSWRFSWDLILQFAGCLCNLNPLSLSCITSFFFLEPPYSKSSTYILAAISLSTQIFDERPSILKYALLGFLLVKMVNANTNLVNCKGALPGLKQLLATESSLKMMKNAFCFILKALFVHKTFKTFVLIFLSCRKTAWLWR